MRSTSPPNPPELEGRPRLRAARAVSLLCLVVGGCSGPRGCSCARPRSAGAGDRDFTDVEIVENGSMPRVDLRVVRDAGLRYRVVLRAFGSLAVEGMPAVPGPTLEMSLDYVVRRGSATPFVERRDGGVARLVEERVVIETLAFRDDRLPKPVLDLWNIALRPLERTAFEERVTEGAAVELTETEALGGIRPPKGVRDAIDRALSSQSQFPFRLPPIPVGLGAHWQLRRWLDVNGARVSEISDMALDAVDGATAKIEIWVHQEAPRQKIPHPLDPARSVVLEEFTGDGEGEITIDRRTAIALSGRLLVTTRSSLADDADAGRPPLVLLSASSITETGRILSGDDGGAPDAATFAPRREPH